MNYIVSGLERSGTSMMMQMLEAGGAPVAYDGSRPADNNNPRGYYELEGGKIITRLAEGLFPMEKYDGKFIKVTAYGIKFLPWRQYKIIYMKRDLDELVISREKMAGKMDDVDEKELIKWLDRQIISLMDSRSDIQYIIVNYGEAIRSPHSIALVINEFLGGIIDVNAAAKAVDNNLYRSKK